MGTVSHWGQEKNKDNIIKGLEDYLGKAKDILVDFVEDLKGTREQLLCISNEDYYLFIVNIMDIFNGTDYETFMEDTKLEDLQITEKGKKIYDFIERQYKYFDDLDMRLSIDNNAEYDIEQYVPNVCDYFILNNLLKILE